MVDSDWLNTIIKPQFRSLFFDDFGQMDDGRVLGGSQTDMNAAFDEKDSERSEQHGLSSFRVPSDK